MNKPVTRSGKAGLLLSLVLAVLLLAAGCTKQPAGNKTPDVTPTPPANAGKTTPVPDDPTPTPAKDYTGDTIEFTNDMPDLVFSQSSIFGTESFALRLYSRFPGTIYYTLDGTTPTEQSTRYDHSTGITLTANEGNIPKVWSVRAAVFYDDGKKSEEFVHSYILGKHVNERYETMVFAINGNPAELYEEPGGIFTEENYEKRGRDSERAVYMEVIGPDGTVVTSQNCGIRVYGQALCAGQERRAGAAGRKDACRRLEVRHHGRVRVRRSRVPLRPCAGEERRPDVSA